MTRLLVVDDEAFQRERIICAAHAAEIRDIKEADSLETASALLDEEFELAVVDLHLGKYEWDDSGVEFIAKLHLRQPRCWIIAFTTKYDNAMGVRGIEAGAKDFISGRWQRLDWTELMTEKLRIYASLAKRMAVLS